MGRIVLSDETPVHQDTGIGLSRQGAGGDDPKPGLGVDISGPMASAGGASAAGDDEPAAAEPLQGALARRIARRVESLARELEPGALVLGAETAGALELRIAIDYAVHFTTRTVDGTGALGAHVQLVDSSSAFVAALGNLLSRTCSESETRLDAWIAANRADYRARLAEAGVRGATTWVGFSWTCESCRGHGRVTCHGCNGSRTLTCTTCNGSGSTRCSNCNGTSRTRCGSCGGSGYQNEQVSVSGWDPATNTNVTRWETRQVRCFGCSGQGELHCAACSNGQRTCGTCSGSGRMNCGT